MGTKLDVLFLVGNGFDLSLGLDTSAKSFVSKFVKETLSKGAGGDGAAFRLASTIESEGIEAWSDFECKIGEYAEAIAQDGQFDKPEDRAEELARAKSAVDRVLAEHIAEEDERVTDEFIAANAEACAGSVACWLHSLAVEQRAKLLGPYHAPYQFEYSFVSFNYTSALERVLQVAGSAGFNETCAKCYAPGLPEATHRVKGLAYAHGTIGDMPICGVDAPDQVHDPDIREMPIVSQTMVKCDIQRMIANGMDIRALEKISNANVICVYGMSLGLTDGRWWRKVAQRLDEESRAALIIFSRRIRQRGMTPFEHYEEILRVRDKYFVSGGIADEGLREKIEDRIIVAPSNEVLVIPKPLK